jgi:hypothetical protein
MRGKSKTHLISYTCLLLNKIRDAPILLVKGDVFLKVCLPLMCKARRTLQFCLSRFTTRTKKYKCVSHFYKLGPKNFIHCSFFYLSPIGIDITSNTLFHHTTLSLFPQLLSCSLLCSSARLVKQAGGMEMETNLSKCLRRWSEGWRWRPTTRHRRCVLVDADRCLLCSSLNLLFPMHP